MGTIKAISEKTQVSSLGFNYEYIAAVITKNVSSDTYGVAMRDVCSQKELCIREVGDDKELVLSIVDTLNNFKVPYVHFLDVVNDLMNKQY